MDARRLTRAFGAFCALFCLSGSVISCGGGSKGATNGSEFDGQAAYDSSGGITNDGSPASSEGGNTGLGGISDDGSGGCVPQTCASQGYNCGSNYDGCGNILNCGSCTAPEFCGGGGYSLCGTGISGADGGDGSSGPQCVPLTCASAGYTCGKNSDGCNNVLDCGTCVAPNICGGGGFCPAPRARPMGSATGAI